MNTEKREQPDNIKRTLQLIAALFVLGAAYYKFADSKEGADHNRIMRDAEAKAVVKQQDVVGLAVADHQKLALQAISENRYVDAEVEATKGLLLRSDALCLLLRGRARQQTGSVDEALADARAGLETADDCDLAVDYRAQLCTLATEVLTAKADRFAANSSDAAASSLYEEAAQYCRQALTLVPNDELATRILSKISR